MKQNLFSILVSNHFGVLMRVTTIFSRRTCNILSLTVAETQDPQISRITILFEAEEGMASQIHKLLAKQEDVIAVDFLSLANPIARELLLLKVCRCDGLPRELEAVPANCHAKIIQENTDSCILEFLGTPAQCDEFLDRMEQRRLIEVCRTGAAALNQGDAMKQ